MSEQEQLARILDNCELWVFDPETAIERLFYSDSFRIGKAVLPGPMCAPATVPAPVPTPVTPAAEPGKYPDENT